MNLTWPWRRYREAADEQLRRAKNDDVRVNEVVEKAANIKAENGFLAAIDHALGRAPQ